MINDHIWGCHDNVSFQVVDFYVAVFETLETPLLWDTQGIQLYPRLP